MKHTSGPWEITSQSGDPDGSFFGVVGPIRTNSLGKDYRLYVAQYCLPQDAPLVASAPDLLAACRCALGHLTGNMDGDMDLGDPVEMLRAAISKARKGEAS